jgi:hypothetical protein
MDTACGLEFFNKLMEGANNFIAYAAGNKRPDIIPISFIYIGTFFG